MNFPFEVTVYVQQRPHMRDENLEYQMHSGKGLLHQIFDEEREDTSVVSALYTDELQVYHETDLSEVAGYDRLNLFKAVVLYP